MFIALILNDNQEGEPTFFEFRLGMNETQVKGLVSMLYKSLNIRAGLPYHLSRISGIESVNWTPLQMLGSRFGHPLY